MLDLKLFLKSELESLLQIQTPKAEPFTYAISRTEMIQILGRKRYYECKEAGLIPFICEEDKKGKHEANRKLFHKMLENLDGFQHIYSQMKTL